MKQSQKIGHNRCFRFQSNFFFSAGLMICGDRPPCGVVWYRLGPIWRRFALHPVTSGSHRVRAKGGNYHFLEKLTTSCNPCPLSLLSGSFIYPAISIFSLIRDAASCREQGRLGVMTASSPPPPPPPPHPHLIILILTLPPPRHPALSLDTLLFFKVK